MFFQANKEEVEFHACVTKRRNKCMHSLSYVRKHVKYSYHIAFLVLTLDA